MRYNLKNFPTWFANSSRGLDSYMEAVEKWKEGFEKELRLFVSIHENEGRDISTKLFRKEILGE